MMEKGRDRKRVSEREGGQEGRSETQSKRKRESQQIARAHLED